MSSVFKDFVPYEETLELKELGFDEPCFGYRESTFGKDSAMYNMFDNIILKFLYFKIC